ncbi:hypothetical protein C8R44DRAFT_815510 [Mycena epipterygia]|nr:hypothetical protein C8R44DRAFT_815510 [Mycena epipterygia]
MKRSQRKWSYRGKPRTSEHLRVVKHKLREQCPGVIEAIQPPPCSTTRGRLNSNLRR